MQARIEADKAARRQKAEAERLARASGGELAGAPAAPASPLSLAQATAASGSGAQEAWLKLQTSKGSLLMEFPAETTLAEVVAAVEKEGVPVKELVQTFPRKAFSNVDFGMTLKEAGLLGSSMLLVR